MAKVYVGGAGGAPSNNFIRSLRESGREDWIIGASCLSSDLFLADADEKYVVPQATAPNYIDKLNKLLLKSQPHFLHVQNDYEVDVVSKFRSQIIELGTKVYLPAAETIDICIDKNKSYECWHRSGIKVPKTRLLNSPADLSRAFNTLGEKIWIRAKKGAAGQGALPTDNFDFAKLWIDRYDGWGKFTAATCLTSETITWLSIWYEGELVVAQTRRRRSWNFSSRALSGVTGITGVGETCSDDLVDRVALAAIQAIDKRPHGIFGVDMTYDNEGVPNPTEINIGRFFTTHYFFTKAGLNMPKIYTDIALEDKFPSLEQKTNPLPDGLIWIRGMDVEPVLTTVEELEAMESNVE